jgi:hypothetical protein
VKPWEVDPAGYSAAASRPYDSITLQGKKVVIHPSWTQVCMTNANYLFNSFQSMTEVSGFENLSGIRSANQMFTSCPMLETIYATNFSSSGLSGSLMFNGCNRLVGGTDGFVPSSTSGASVCKIGTGGVLTDPNNDARTWFYGHFYEDGEAVLTATPTPNAKRALRATGRICAIGKYVGLGFTPWTGTAGSTHRLYLTSVTFAADMAAFTNLNLNCRRCRCHGRRNRNVERHCRFAHVPRKSGGRRHAEHAYENCELSSCKAQRSPRLAEGGRRHQIAHI